MRTIPAIKERLVEVEGDLRNLCNKWKNRQKRKGHDDAVPWTSGWISGYLTGGGGA